MTGTVTIRDVEVDGERVDVVISAGTVAEVRPAGTAAAGADELDGGGAALVPGLHDHHIHLLALAAALDSVQLGPEVGGEAAARAALRAAPSGPGGWVRAVGYHDDVAGPLDRHRLDALVDDRPARVQHRSGSMWVLNSRALEAVGLTTGSAAPDGVETGPDGTPTGRLHRLDTWLRRRLPPRAPRLDEVSRLLLAHGVTGVTDTTPFATWDDAAPLTGAVRDGSFRPSLTLTGSPALDPAAAPARVGVGPAKLLLPDHDLPGPDAVAEQIATAREHRRRVAVHCVTRAALVVTLAAFEAVGSLPGDRIEHAAVVPPELAGMLGRHGLAVVTQPGFVATRGDQYLREVDPDDLDHLWPCRSLLDAGIAVAAGSDAPFGPADPWVGIDAAIRRRTPSGTTLGPHETIGAAAALGLYLGRPEEPGGAPRRVRPGERTDLCLLDRSGSEALAAPREVNVVATVVGGSLLPTRP